MKRFNNKTICITGSNRGLGKEIAEKFAQEGANLILCARKETDDFISMISAFKNNYNVAIYPVYFDLKDDESIKNGMKEIKSLKIKIDVLVNNAGMPHLAILPFTKMADAKEVFQVNYFAQLMITQSLLGRINKSEGSSIINIASIAGIDGDMGNSVYGATKASMILFTKVLSKELAGKIRVNAVAPGLIETDFADTMGNKAKESMMATSISGRLAKTEEVASTVLFLASKEASFINGEIIRIDGGKR